MLDIFTSFKWFVYALSVLADMCFDAVLVTFTGSVEMF